MESDKGKKFKCIKVVTGFTVGKIYTCYNDNYKLESSFKNDFGNRSGNCPYNTHFKLVSTPKKSNLFEKEVILVPNWKNIPVGSLIEGTIEGRKFKGRVQKEKSHIFICQNTESGDSCENKLGFKYSWNIITGSKDDLEVHEVIISNIKLDPKFKAEQPIMIGSNEVKFLRGKIKVGCTTVSNKVVLEISKKLKK